MKNSKKKFKMRREPRKPKRKSETVKEYLWDICIPISNPTLQGVVDKFTNAGINLDQVKIDGLNNRLIWEESESEDKFSLRMEKWQKKKKEYDIWVEENAEKIKQYKKEQAEIKIQNLLLEADKYQQHRKKIEEEILDIKNNLSLSIR